MRTLGQLRNAARSSLVKATTLIYDRRRGSPSARGYGRYWERRRAIQLRREPLCRHCKARGLDVPATDVDHIVSKAKGGPDEFANYQSLCHACHSAKTIREDGALRTGRYDGLQSAAGEQANGYGPAMLERNVGEPRPAGLKQEGTMGCTVPTQTPRGAV